MTPNEKQAGFTILEVTLVLAISSLMLIFILTGITLAVQRQRFSDSVNSTQSFLQQQFSFTQNTINNRPTGACPVGTPDTSIRGASGCLILGRLLEIEDSAGDNESFIAAYDVIGADVDTSADPYKTYSDLELIRAIEPTEIEQANSSGRFLVPWGTHITTIRDDTTKSGAHKVRYVALLRSPRSGVIHVYKIEDINDLADGSTLLSSNKDDSNIREIEHSSVKMCLDSVDLFSHSAMLAIAPTSSQDGITSHFDDTDREAYGC